MTFDRLSTAGTLRLEWSDKTEEWTVLHPVIVTWTGGSIMVPAGFTTDLSSIPEWARGLIPQVGKHNVPSVVHDWCYQHRWHTREESDWLFLELMALHGVPWLRRNVMWCAVRAAGQGVWETD